MLFARRQTIVEVGLTEGQLRYWAPGETGLRVKGVGAKRQAAGRKEIYRHPFGDVAIESEPFQKACRKIKIIGVLAEAYPREGLCEFGASDEDVCVAGKIGRKWH